MTKKCKILRNSTETFVYTTKNKEMGQNFNKGAKIEKEAKFRKKNVIENTN